MIVSKKMIRNQFKNVFLPDGRDLYSRYGARSGSGLFSSNNPDDCSSLSFGHRKLDTLAQAEVLEMSNLRRDSESHSTPSNIPSNPESTPPPPQSAQDS